MTSKSRERGASLALTVTLTSVIVFLGIIMFVFLRFFGGNNELGNATASGST